MFKDWMTSLKNALLGSVGTTFQKTVSLNQIAGTYDIATCSTKEVEITSLSIKMPTGDCGGACTGISIQTNDATPVVFLSQADGVVANLTSEALLAWPSLGTAVLLNVGKKVQLTIYGGAHGSAYNTTVTLVYRQVAGAGSLV